MSTPTTGALMVVGATSGAGKSTVCAALCRAWHRRGLPVAPFKAQNMSNHAAVTADGGEIGRAQAMQAAAAGVDIDRRMNPVLLKPNLRGDSHVVVLGDERRATDAVTYGELTTDLKPVVLDALNSLRRDHRWVVAEGAGGAAEINLLERDLVNLPLARAARLPAILVVDIDRGGAFAAAHGTMDILPPPLRDCIAGVVFNRFRGDTGLLRTGISQLERRMGVPVLGVLPDLGMGPLLGVEDSLDVAPFDNHPRRSPRPVRVAVIRLPHLANPSDFDPLTTEPDVSLSWVTRSDQLETADVVILPGSRATVADLDWLRHHGLDRAVLEVARTGSVLIVGICAGYQMLGATIHDSIESGAGEVPGLGLLQSNTTFAEPKIVRRSTGSVRRSTGSVGGHRVAGYQQDVDGVIDVLGSVGSHRVAGYQIRFGRPVSTEAPWLELDGRPEGAISASGTILATSLHGVFDADGFRTHLLAEVANMAGRNYDPAPQGFTDAIETQHERLADWIEDHLDVEAVVGIAATAAPPDESPGW